MAAIPSKQDGSQSAVNSSAQWYSFKQVYYSSFINLFLWAIRSDWDFDVFVCKPPLSLLVETDFNIGMSSTVVRIKIRNCCGLLEIFWVHERYLWLANIHRFQEIKMHVCLGKVTPYLRMIDAKYLSRDYNLFQPNYLIRRLFLRINEQKSDRGLFGCDMNCDKNVKSLQ